MGRRRLERKMGNRRERRRGASRDLCVTRGRVPGRPLTGFGRGRPNPGSSPGQTLPLPSERPLRNPEVVARKTPHRFRPKTPESASPPGEGKERRLLEGIDPAHPPAKTAPASPRGVARGRAPEDEGYAKVSSERVKSRHTFEDEGRSAKVSRGRGSKRGRKFEDQVSCAKVSRGARRRRRRRRREHGGSGVWAWDRVSLVYTK